MKQNAAKIPLIKYKAKKDIMKKRRANFMKRNYHRMIGYILAGVVGTVSLAGCAAMSSFTGTANYLGYNGASSSAASHAPLAAPQEAAEEKGVFYDMDDAVTGEANELENISTNAAAQPRKIIRNAELHLETMEYKSALEKIPALAEQSGGYIESSSSDGISLYEKSNTRPSRRSASFTVRIPADNLDSFITSLSTEFNLLNKFENSSDISDRYYDTQAHLSNLQIQEKRLLELLEQAGKLGDLLEIEKELADVRYQIETLTATIKRMDSQVSYSTVTISLEEVVEYKEVTAPPRTFGDRLAETFKDSWNNFLNVCENVLFTIIYVAPLVLLIAVIVVIIIFIIRAATRRKKIAKEGNTELKGWKAAENKQDTEHKED
jgi:hypothetical protein